MFGIFGGALGLALGVIGIRALLALNPGSIPRVGVDGSGVGVDARVLAFTAIVSLATGLIFGLFPVLRASRADLGTALKESSGQSGGGFRHTKARAPLVVSEMGWRWCCWWEPRCSFERSWPCGRLNPGSTRAGC